MDADEKRAEWNRAAEKLAQKTESCSIGCSAHGDHPCTRVPCWALQAILEERAALLDEVERLRNCEPDPPPLTDESLRTELRGVYDALDRAMRERDAFRDAIAEALRQVDIEANSYEEDDDRGREQYASQRDRADDRRSFRRPPGA